MQVKHREEKNAKRQSAKEQTTASEQDSSHAADRPDAQCDYGERVFKIFSKYILHRASGFVFKPPRSLEYL
jgi:hypothetical protein